MSKKTFTGGLNSLLGESPSKPSEREALRERDEEIRDRAYKEVMKSTKEGLQPNETRATFIVDEGLLSKVKALAYWERLQMKEVIDKLFSEGIESYEKKNGEIKPIPPKK